MRHSQGIFRLSLGFADIIVGLITLPMMVNTVLKNYQYSIELQSPMNAFEQETFLLTNESYRNSKPNLTIDKLETRIMVINRIFPLNYLNSIGFFTTVSLTTSVYLLTFSGIDRLRALLQPLLYNQLVAKRFAISTSIICWLLAIFFSILPTFFDNLSYVIVASSFVTLGGTIALIVYVVQFFLPLLTIWIISIAIYVIARKIFNKVLNSESDEMKVEQQRKLNCILFWMVAAFSFSLLPSVFVLLLVLFIPGIYPQFLNTYNPMNSNIANSLEITAVLILISNSLWNCLIYSVRTKKFRTIALKKYKKIWILISRRKLFLSLKETQALQSTDRV